MLPTSSRWLLPCLITLALLGSASHGTATVLYDVDFGTPPHAVGQPPLTGAGAFPRDTPSSMLLGTDAVVVAGYGALSDQPLYFAAPPTGSDSVHFEDLAATAFDAFSISFDVLPLALDYIGNEFRIYVDGPAANRIALQSDGGIEIVDLDLGSVVVATFEFGELLEFDIDVDVLARTWTIAIGGEEIHSGNLRGNLSSASFRMGTFGNSYEVLADNVLIVGVPEPSRATMLVVGIASLAFCARAWGREGSRGDECAPEMSRR